MRSQRALGRISIHPKIVFLFLSPARADVREFNSHEIGYALNNKLVLPLFSPDFHDDPSLGRRTFPYVAEMQSNGRAENGKCQQFINMRKSQRTHRNCGGNKTMSGRVGRSNLSNLRSIVIITICSGEKSPASPATNRTEYRIPNALVRIGRRTYCFSHSFGQINLLMLSLCQDQHLLFSVLPPFFFGDSRIFYFYFC